MHHILKKSASPLTLKAGPIAKAHILQSGLSAQDVDTLPGPAGGPKSIGIFGLDQAIFNEFLPQASKQRTLIASSIGAWRFASIYGLGHHIRFKPFS